jgi:hypothetical protein
MLNQPPPKKAPDEIRGILGIQDAAPGSDLVDFWELLDLMFPEFPPTERNDVPRARRFPAVYYLSWYEKTYQLHHEIEQDWDDTFVNRIHGPVPEDIDYWRGIPPLTRERMIHVCAAMVEDADYEALSHHYDANYCMPWLDAWRKRIEDHTVHVTKTCPDLHVPVIAFELPLKIMLGSDVRPENITILSHVDASGATATNEAGPENADKEPSRVSKKTKHVARRPADESR